MFEYLEGRLLATAAQVVLCDDGAGEIADYIALFDAGGTTRVELYHCKPTKTDPIPGNRIKDLYEVTGQAVKSVRWTGGRKLREQVHHRLANTKGCRFVLGDRAIFDRLLSDGRGVSFEIVIVQPTVGASPSQQICELLAATNAYLVAGQVAPLRVIGSSP